MAEMLAMHGAIASGPPGMAKCWQRMEQLPVDEMTTSAKGSGARNLPTAMRCVGDNEVTDASLVWHAG
jgi:hypothetical protein